MFRPLFAPLLAILTLTGTAGALAAETQSPPADTAAPAARQSAAPANDSAGSRSEISLLLVLAFASIGGGVGLIAAGRAAAAEPRPSA